MYEMLFLLSLSFILEGPLIYVMLPHSTSHYKLLLLLAAGENRQPALSVCDIVVTWRKG